MAIATKESRRKSKTRGANRFAGWYEWEAPFDLDPDWPSDLQNALKDYRAGWRAKMDEVNACIAANAEQEELIDKPEVVRSVVRVSGPFTFEAVQPPEMSMGDVESTFDGEGMFDGEPEMLDTTFKVRVIEPLGDMEVKKHRGLSGPDDPFVTHRRCSVPE